MFLNRNGFAKSWCKATCQSNQKWYSTVPACTKDIKKERGSEKRLLQCYFSEHCKNVHYYSLPARNVLVVSTMGFFSQKDWHMNNMLSCTSALQSFTNVKVNHYISTKVPFAKPTPEQVLWDRCPRSFHQLYCFDTSKQFNSLTKLWIISDKRVSILKASKKEILCLSLVVKKKKRLN